GFAGLLHEPSALAHHPQAILKAHCTRRRQCREFAERQTGGGVKFERWRLFLEQLKCDPTHKEDAGLGVFSFREFSFRTVETNRSQVVAERSVGAVEPGFGRRKFFSEILAHAGGLRALSGKQQCGFSHKQRTLHMKSARNERLKKLCR